MELNKRICIFFAVILITLSITPAACATAASGGAGSGQSPKNATPTHISWGRVPAPVTSSSDSVPGAGVTGGLLSLSGTSVKYTIDSSAGLHGKISPSKKQKLPAGETITFRIVPDAGFTIAAVLVDGKPVSAVSAYTFSSVNANHTISATFKKGVVENQNLVSAFFTWFDGSGKVIEANSTTFYWDGKGRVYLTGGNGYLDTYADDAFDVSVDGSSLSFSRADHRIYRGIPEITSICHPGVNNLTLNIRDIYGSPVGCGETWLWFDQKLTANFTGTPLSGPAPLTVNFTDTSTGSPKAWKWDFGDGKTSRQQNPLHTYTSAGTYTVSLMVQNADEIRWLNRTPYINVTRLEPVVNFTATPLSGFAPLTVQFTDESIGSADCWKWEFGDGTTSFKRNVSHVFSHSGLYTVNHAARNITFGTGWMNRTDYIKVINPAPTVYFSGTPHVGFNPLTVQFNDSSTYAPTSWFWLFGDGSSSRLMNPIHTYTTPGIYTVNHSASNAGGTRWKNITAFINVTNAVLPVASFIGTPTTGPAQLLVQFTDSSTGSPTSWMWDFGDGRTATTKNVSHTYTTEGRYSVKLKVTNGLGSNTVTRMGYITVTAPISNQATDVAGRLTIDQLITEDAAAKQKLMNYNPTIIIQPNPDTIKSRLPNDQVFFFSGHGGSGVILIKDTSPSYLFFAKNTSDGYNFDDASSSYSNMKLAVFFGCNTGNTDTLTGNLVKVVVSKGAGCAMGWTKEIIDEGSKSYSTVFWDNIKNGKSILTAATKGETAARNNPTCVQLYKENATKWGHACNLEEVYHLDNNGQCTQPLPNTFTTMLRDTATQNSEELDSGTTLVTFNEKEQISKAVSKFTKKSVVESFSSKKVFHYTYMDLFEVNSGDISYWINNDSGRVQSMVIYNAGSKTLKEVIDLSQGSIIAESYAKEKYPELWNETDKKGIKQTIKKVNDRGSDRIFEYSWQEILKVHDSNISHFLEIPDMNSVTVIVSPYTGQVLQYHEWYIPNNSTLNLTPTVREEQALNYAKMYFQKAGFTNNLSTQINPLGLSITIDENNDQLLIWSFEVIRTDEHGYNESGFVGIDAHNGQVVWHASVNGAK